MDGLSRWDVVLWIIVVYVAVTAMVRMMLAYRDATVRKLTDRLAKKPRRNKADENAKREAA
ncbi:MAG TPA: hypothetical protein VFE46_03960 [Pirellulales bacterium]|nr:hypothetical protein [Pirellulales bacterium]